MLLRASIVYYNSIVNKLLREPLQCLLIKGVVDVRVELVALVDSDHVCPHLLEHAHARHGPSAVRRVVVPLRRVRSQRRAPVLDGSDEQ